MGFEGMLEEAERREKYEAYLAMTPEQRAEHIALEQKEAAEREDQRLALIVADKAKGPARFEEFKDVLVKMFGDMTQSEFEAFISYLSTRSKGVAFDVIQASASHCRYG